MPSATLLPTSLIIHGQAPRRVLEMCSSVESSRDFSESARAPRNIPVVTSLSTSSGEPTECLRIRRAGLCLNRTPVQVRPSLVTKIPTSTWPCFQANTRKTPSFILTPAITASPEMADEYALAVDARSPSMTRSPLVTYSTLLITPSPKSTAFDDAVIIDVLRMLAGIVCVGGVIFSLQWILHETARRTQ